MNTHGGGFGFPNPNNRLPALPVLAAGVQLSFVSDAFAKIDDAHKDQHAILMANMQRIFETLTDNIADVARNSATKIDIQQLRADLPRRAVFEGLEAKMDIIKENVDGLMNSATKADIQQLKDKLPRQTVFDGLVEKIDGIAAKVDDTVQKVFPQHDAFTAQAKQAECLLRELHTLSDVLKQQFDLMSSLLPAVRGARFPGRFTDSQNQVTPPRKTNLQEEFISPVTVTAPNIPEHHQLSQADPNDSFYPSIKDPEQPRTHPSGFLPSHVEARHRYDNDIEQVKFSQELCEERYADHRKAYRSSSFGYLSCCVTQLVLSTAISFLVTILNALKMTDTWGEVISTLGGILSGLLVALMALFQWQSRMECHKAAMRAYQKVFEQLKAIKKKSKTQGLEEVEKNIFRAEVLMEAIEENVAHPLAGEESCLENCLRCCLRWATCGMYSG